MLGIKFFKPTPSVEPIPFDYEIRQIEYYEMEDFYYIAGGDKAGKLVIFTYDGKEIKIILEKRFPYKIISMDFIIYGEQEDRIGFLVALEVKDKPNLFFLPDVHIEKDNGDNPEAPWCIVENSFGTPQLILQPYIMKDLSKIFFSFKEGYAIIASLKGQGERFYRLESEWEHSFPSRIIDGCVEFPKYLKRTRQENKEKGNHMYLASKAGCILILSTNRDFKFPPDKNFPVVHRLKTIPNSIRTITPISKIPYAKATLRGILGISGAELFCLYRDNESYHEKGN